MQQKSPSSKKNIIITIIVIVIIALGYFYYTGSTPTDEAISSLSGEAPSQIVGSQTLVLLNQLNSLRIDPKIFQSQVYQSLVDHTVMVREQNVGRANPFAPAFTAPPARPATTRR
jgi:hypothetical protein